MKKKFFIISICFIVFFILINIFYDFFYGDNINNIIDKILFRKNYYLREILECNYNEKNSVAILSKNNISIKLSNVNYETEAGVLNVNFDIYTNNNEVLNELRFMLCVHDNKTMFYNNSVGDMLFVGNTDYLVYNKNLYSKLSTKKLNYSKLNEEKKFDIVNTSSPSCKNIKLEFNLGENYKIQDKLYIEFLDLIYKPQNDTSHKIFNPLGEFKFVIAL